MDLWSTKLFTRQYAKIYGSDLDGRLLWIFFGSFFVMSSEQLSIHLTTKLYETFGWTVKWIFCYQWEKMDLLGGTYKEKPNSSRSFTLDGTTDSISMLTNLCNKKTFLSFFSGKFLLSANWVDKKNLFFGWFGFCSIWNTYTIFNFFMIRSTPSASAGFGAGTGGLLATACEH